MKLSVIATAIAALFMQGAIAAPPEVKWDSTSLIINGKRVMPVSGEIHYSRLPADEWRREIKKMKEGGVTIIATYVFWNHIEEKEGVFDWSGDRDLRRFLEACKDEEMPVILRLGPFCHGEVRNGGIPDWVLESGCKVRSEDPGFLRYVERLYRQIFTQLQGLQWKDGGPVIGCQFDNEYRGHGSYLMALKNIALGIGYDLPLYTRTGWPELTSPVPYGEMIPLYGDYADGFWERSIEPTAGEYYKAFNFKEFRSSTAIASEQLGTQREAITEGDGAYPYFTCELGGGMMTAYHRRPWIYPEDAYSLAIVKLGSGSNLLGYYMYHGGTNPEGETSLNETQRTIATNYNDMPEKNYDFQAPLGEFGQANPHYYTLRKLHMFMEDFGETLAPMPASFRSPQQLKKGEDKTLRWSLRSLGDSGFVFINNYERLQKLSDKKNVRFDVGAMKFPSRPFTIPSGTSCIFPFNIAGIKYATAQLTAMRDGKIYLEQIPGIPTEIAVGSKILRNVKALGKEKPVWGNIYLLSPDEAGKLFLSHEPATAALAPPRVTKIKDAAISQRKITLGAKGVAESPEEKDFEAAAVYTIDNLPDAADRKGCLLDIEYRGDVARLYCDGKLIADNFYNGRHFLYGLWRLPEGCTSLTLKILPLQPKMPVYFPEEADTTPGEDVIKAAIWPTHARQSHSQENGS